MKRNPVKLKARIEKVWVLSLGDVEIPMRFKKENEMADMVLLRDSVGNDVVIDMPSRLDHMVNSILEIDEGFEVDLIKASQQFQDAVKEAMERVSKAAAESPEEPETVEETEPENEDELGDEDESEEQKTSGARGPGHRRPSK